MLMRVARLLGLAQFINKEPKRKKDSRTNAIWFDMRVQSRDLTVRIVHAGGREEFYQNAILASQIMAKYPGMCVARPEVFRKPHESLLSAEEKLLPGHKYYMIPSTTARKLKSRHPKRKKAKQSTNVADVLDFGEDCESDYSVYFYTSMDRWSECLSRKDQRVKNTFVSPVQKPRLWKSFEWEPSLTSVQEQSP